MAHTWTNLGLKKGGMGKYCSVPSIESIGSEYFTVEQSDDCQNNGAFGAHLGFLSSYAYTCTAANNIYVFLLLFGVLNFNYLTIFH
jgi:hypothetical protein